MSPSEKTGGADERLLAASMSSGSSCCRVRRRWILGGEGERCCRHGGQEPLPRIAKSQPPAVGRSVLGVVGRGGGEAAGPARGARVSPWRPTRLATGATPCAVAPVAGAASAANVLLPFVASHPPPAILEQWTGRDPEVAALATSNGLLKKAANPIVKLVVDFTVTIKHSHKEKRVG